MNTNRNQNASRPNKNSPDKVKEPRPKVTGIEATLVGKKIIVRSNDWQRSLTGILRKVEKFLLILDTDKGAIVVYKHAISSIGLVKEEAQAE